MSGVPEQLNNQPIDPNGGDMNSITGLADSLPRAFEHARGAPQEPARDFHPGRDIHPERNYPFNIIDQEDQEDDTPDLLDQYQKNQGNAFFTFATELYNNKYTWRFLKGMLVLLVALRVAHEFDFLPNSLSDLVPFRQIAWMNVKEFFGFEV